MSESQAIEIVCRAALEWAGEYGFTQPDEATRVVEAAELLAEALKQRGKR